MQPLLASVVHAAVARVMAWLRVAQYDPPTLFPRPRHMPHDTLALTHLYARIADDRSFD